MAADRAGRSSFEAGWDALGDGDWNTAKGRFEESLALEMTPEALEGLGWAGYFLDEDQLTFDARERAYRLYLELGDNSSAARVAAWIAADCLEFRGEPAVANGWLQRAHTLLDEMEPGIDHGWLAINEASFLIDDDTTNARLLGVDAVQLGRKFGVPELEMVGLGLEGLALVRDGEVGEGMRLLDEATAVALTGEAKILACVAWACCYLIAACEEVRDYDRAGQWCLRIGEYCERNGISLLLGVCQAKYAGVLSWQGRWTEAEDELRSATETIQASRPALIEVALARVAELRRLQGRLDEAEELFERCKANPLAIAGRAAIALDRGQPAEAAELTDRFLRHFADPARLERSTGLELAVLAHVQLDELDLARKALDQLRDIGLRAGTGPLRAAVCASEGRLSAALGDYTTARTLFEDAIDLLTSADAPFETSRVRLDLAATLEALGRTEPARREIEAALAVFRRLGAVTEEIRGEDMLSRLPRARRSVPTTLEGPLRQLSKREVEVLAFVAEGLTNQEIADRLMLSEHTIHRHVTNILRKLAVPSRAAAASLAGRHGI
jgi:DNA-binding CsgD family transcriptional regulator